MSYRSSQPARTRTDADGRGACRIGPRQSHARRFRWVDLPDQDLLNVRLCDLGVQYQGTWLEDAVDRLWGELDSRGLIVRPHAWLSNEWFCPDGVPGFAIPFYLSHPRLMRVEAMVMNEVEGGTVAECMKLLRHETGHAIQNAFRLHRRPLWQKLFGSATQPYPLDYRPRPLSRHHVQHLDYWYAQSHPVEDFAETFAVWLTPRSRWRERYAGWPALKKLEYVDQLMSELSGQRPPVRSRMQVDALPQLRLTLREHYRHKRAFYRAAGTSRAFDGDLRMLFPPVYKNPGYESAAAFLHRHRAVIRDRVTRFAREYETLLEHVMREMIARCRQLRLRRATPEAQAVQEFSLMLTARTIEQMHTRRERYAL